MTRSSIDLAAARCMPAGLLSDFYGRQPAATLITKDEARPIAANIAKLSALVEVANHRNGIELAALTPWQPGVPGRPQARYCWAPVETNLGRGSLCSTFPLG